VCCVVCNKGVAGGQFAPLFLKLSPLGGTKATRWLSVECMLHGWVGGRGDGRWVRRTGVRFACRVHCDWTIMATPVRHKHKFASLRLQAKVEAWCRDGPGTVALVKLGLETIGDVCYALRRFAD
jgi:hypothetical protein